VKRTSPSTCRLLTPVWTWSVSGRFQCCTQDHLGYPSTAGASVPSVWLFGIEFVKQTNKQTNEQTNKPSILNTHTGSRWVPSNHTQENRGRFLSQCIFCRMWLCPYVGSQMLVPESRPCGCMPCDLESKMSARKIRNEYQISIPAGGETTHSACRGSWRIFGDASVTIAQWRGSKQIWFIRRSQVRFQPKPRRLKSMWIWANGP